MLPVPVRAAPEKTSKSPEPVPLPETLFTRSVPALTVVPPVKVLLPLKVSRPVPILFTLISLPATALLLLMLPLKFASELLPPMTKSVSPAPLADCAPASEPEPENAPSRTVLPALRGCSVPLMTNVGDSEP